MVQRARKLDQDFAASGDSARALGNPPRGQMLASFAYCLAASLIHKVDQFDRICAQHPLFQIRAMAVVPHHVLLRILIGLGWRFFKAASRGSSGLPPAEAHIPPAPARPLRSSGGLQPEPPGAACPGPFENAARFPARTSATRSAPSLPEPRHGSPMRDL